VAPKRLESLACAAAVSALAALQDEIEIYWQLSQRRILPHYFQLRAVAVIDVLESLSAACCDSVVNIDGLVLQLQNSLQSLKRFLSFKEADAGPGHWQTWLGCHYSLRCSRC